MTGPCNRLAPGTRVLVTGGAGAIGSRLVRRLLGLKAEVTVLDDLSGGFRFNLPDHPQLCLVVGDVTSPAGLEAAWHNAPQVVFHLAAHFANQRSVEEPVTNLETNGVGTLRVLEQCRARPVDRVVVAGSGCGAYGPETPQPFREETVSLRMGTPYQVTKLLTEMLGTCYHDLHGVPVAVARLFNVYGPGEVPGRYRNVIPNFVYWARQGRPLPVTGDGSERRDWTFVEDAIDGLLALATVPGALGEAFNIASGRSVAVLDMARQVNELTGNKAGIEFLPRRDWDHKPQLLADIGKAGRVLGFTPRWSFAHGLAEVEKWFSENWQAIMDQARF